MAISKKIRQRNNENAAKYFAAGVGGIMLLFIICHWMRVMYKKYGVSKKGASSTFKIPIALTRIAKSFLARKIPLFPSFGHNLVFLCYIIINLCVTFTNIDWTNLVGLSKRLGWTTVSNLALVIFLSLKNTPLALLSKHSYEELQPLHQIAGYTMVACWFMHAIVYIACWDDLHNLHELLEREQIMGITAGFALLILLFTTLIRHKNYELFYIIHITLAILILITAGLHRPKLAQKSCYAIIFSASIWVLDRLVRVFRVSFYGVGNTATLMPLPHGGTRVVLKKKVIGAKAGMHVFLYVPSVRKVQMHPFTIVSTSPLELVVAARDGFTRALHTEAVKNPGMEMMASVDGPYGSIPDLKDADKVMFVAGGSGGSYTAGVAVEFLRSLKSDGTVRVEFVWVVRHTDILTWFHPQLQELASSQRVNLHIYITHHSDTSPPTPNEIDSHPSSPSVQSSAMDLEKANFPSTTETYPQSRQSSTHDIEKGSPPSTKERKVYPVMSGRPSVAALIEELVNNSKTSDRLAIVACGPRGMMLQVRGCVVDNLRAEGPSLDLHLEAFGW